MTWYKANEFERDLGGARARNANIQYTVDSVGALGENNFQLLEKIISNHMTEQFPRLNMLYDYYQNNNTGILSKSRRNAANSEKADNRPAHPFASFINDFHTTYSVGKPVKAAFKVTDDAGDIKNDVIQEINAENHTDTLNYELYGDMGRYGRAYEQVFYDGEQVRFARLSPFSTFIIYDTSVIPKPLMSVRYTEKSSFEAGDQPQFSIDAYTETKHIQMTMMGAGGALQLVSMEDNALGQIPVIEYENNNSRTGDFEKVIPLIDLYDAAQADTANYMQDFVDALLTITGDLEDFTEEHAKLLQDANILALKSGKDINGNSTDVDAKYLTKSMDSGSVEAYKSRVAGDIYTFSKTPNYVDKDFSSNTSGVALKYRMLSTVSMAEVKRHGFSQGLAKRYKMMYDLLRLVNQVPAGWDMDKLTFNYTDNLPLDESTAITEFISLGGKVSLETALKHVEGVLVDDVPDEVKRLEAEGAEINSWISQGAAAPANDTEETDATSEDEEE